MKLVRYWKRIISSFCHIWYTYLAVKCFRSGKGMRSAEYFTMSVDKTVSDWPSSKHRCCAGIVKTDWPQYIIIKLVSGDISPHSTTVLTQPFAASSRVGFNSVILWPAAGLWRDTITHACTPVAASTVVLVLGSWRFYPDGDAASTHLIIIILWPTFQSVLSFLPLHPKPSAGYRRRKHQAVVYDIIPVDANTKQWFTTSFP